MYRPPGGPMIAGRHPSSSHRIQNHGNVNWELVSSCGSRSITGGLHTRQISLNIRGKKWQICQNNPVIAAQLICCDTLPFQDAPEGDILHEAPFILWSLVSSETKTRIPSCLFRYVATDMLAVIRITVWPMILSWKVVIRWLTKYHLRINETSLEEKPRGGNGSNTSYVSGGGANILANKIRDLHTWARIRSNSGWRSQTPQPSPIFHPAWVFFPSPSGLDMWLGRSADNKVKKLTGDITKTWRRGGC